MTSELTEKLIQLVERLEVGTRLGQIEWEPTDRRSAYLYSTPSSSVILATVDDDGQAPFQLQVLNDRGDVIESITSHRRQNSQYVLKEGGTALTSLYEQARRLAMGVDAAIDALLETLPPLPDEDDYPF